MNIEKIGSIAMYAQMRVPKEPEKPKQFISKFYPDTNMSSIYTTGFEFSWISKVGSQCMPFASCRDYLQGTAWSAYNNSTKTTHSLEFNPKTFPKIDLNNIRIAVRYKDASNESLKEYCKNSLELINKIEEEMELSKSILTYGGLFKPESLEVEVEPVHATWVFKGGKSWMRSVYHMSLYSLLIRAGTRFKGEPWRKFLNGGIDNFALRADKKYLVGAMEGIEAIVKDKEQTLFAKLAKDNFPIDIRGIRFDKEGIRQFSEGFVDEKLKVNWQDKEFKL